MATNQPSHAVSEEFGQEFFGEGWGIISHLEVCGTRGALGVPEALRALRLFSVSSVFRCWGGAGTALRGYEAMRDGAGEDGCHPEGVKRPRDDIKRRNYASLNPPTAPVSRSAASAR